MYLIRYELGIPQTTDDNQDLFLWFGQRRKTQAVFFSWDENMAVFTIRNRTHPSIAGEFSFSSLTTAAETLK